MSANGDVIVGEKIPENFEVGDTVYLKSQMMPLMVVCNVDLTSVSVAWFDDARQAHWNRFPKACLVIRNKVK